MDKNDEEQALKFVRNAQITSYFTPSTDTKLNNIANSMKDAQTFERFNHNLAKHQTWPLKITNDAIEEMMCSSSHEEYKKRNYIDPTLKLEWENIKEFREKREEAIITKLKEVLLPKSS
ncbi:hypothetical protein C2R82_07685 [Helicobacter pylori]|nr:hypothetical protein C2R82_07685 [Helicobacter pylori]WRF22202.1 hypothetical protein KVE95_04445 [Helicobacter pylori]